MTTQTETEVVVDVKERIAENRAKRKELVELQKAGKKILRTDWRLAPSGVNIAHLQWATMKRAYEITCLLVQYHRLCDNDEKAASHRYKN